jgi:hypothetical protein
MYRGFEEQTQAQPSASDYVPALGHLIPGMDLMTKTPKQKTSKSKGPKYIGKLGAGKAGYVPSWRPTKIPE